MKHKLLIIINCLLFTLSVSAQKPKSDANIYGHVTSEGKHLPFVNVVVKGTTIGTVTDETGHYQLVNLPEGSLTVVVSGLGFKSKEQEVFVSTNTSKEIKFDLEPDRLGLDEVVVSADRNQTNRKEAPVIVSSINPKLFANTQSVNIAEGLCFSPGLRTECNCQNCGFTQLRMNGLDGPYTQILMNSRPVFSGLAGVYGLELIPASMVERLEVVRGGGSALFGGNAIAGTVNIITKEPKHNTFMVDGRYGLIGVGNEHGDTEPAADAQFNANASVVSDDQKTGAYIYAMLRDREAHDENGDDYSESVLMENTTFGFNVYHKPGNKSKISLDGYRINEFRRGGNKLDHLAHEADIAEQVEHTVTGGNLAFDLFTSDNYDKLTVYAAGQTVERNAYYGAEQDPNAYGKTDDFTSSVGAQYILNADRLLFAPSSTVFGIDNNYNQIEDIKLGAGEETNTTLTDQTVNTFGTFVQQDWKTNKINLSAGLRYDNYIVQDKNGNKEERADDVSKGVLAPRISTLYKITPNVRLRASYAKGYRAPQVFNEDLHIELVDAKRVIHLNDEDLVQETSHTYTVSLNTNFTLGSTISDFLVEGFYTQLQNAFADEFYELDDEGNWAYLRVNAEDGASVMGVNIEYHTHYLNVIDFQLGLTLQQSEYEKEQQWGEEDNSLTKKFIRSPDQYGYATLTWNATKKLSTTVSLNYTGSMYTPHFGLSKEDHKTYLAEGTIKEGDVIVGEELEKTEQFLITDFLVNYDFTLSGNTKLKVYAGVKNIFNQTQERHDSGKYRDAGYIYGPCQPRTINFGIKVGNFL